MNNCQFIVSGLSKYFGKKVIFKDINFELNSPTSLVITGKNGSGKSTLLKIFAGLLAPTKGVFQLNINGEKIINENMFAHLGYVSPYLVFYEEFSLIENLNFISRIRGINPDNPKIKELLSKVGLYERRNDQLKTYSSGMKQRVKYISSLLHNPPVLLYDEPTANLDDDGKKFVFDLVEKESKEKIVIIATNERNELGLAKQVINLDEFKS